MKRTTVIFSLALTAIALLASCASTKPATLPGKEITDWQARHENIMATTFATREQIANFPRQESKNPAVSMAHKIPSEYLADSRHEGKIIEVRYTATDRAGDGSQIEKVADVYIPYNYERDAKTRYSTVYLVHGWTGTSDVYFACDEGKHDLQNLLDNMIEKGDIPSVIVVTPTWDRDNKGKPLDESIKEMSVFWEELEKELVPYIDSNFRTIADRDHRAATGFSLGAASTWYSFIHSMSLFRYYLPASGNCFAIEERSEKPETNAETAAFLVQTLQSDNVSPGDYFIYSVAGTNDVAFRLNESLNNELVKYPDYFNERNFVYQLNEGGIHWWDSIQVDFYNALPLFFKK